MIEGVLCALVAIHAVAIGWVAVRFKSDRNAEFEARILKGKVLTLTEQAGRLMAVAESVVLRGPSMGASQRGGELTQLVQGLGSLFAPQGKASANESTPASAGD